MGVLLRFLLIFGLIYYFFRFISRLFSFTSSSKQKYNSNQSYHNGKKEGDVTINKKPDTSKHIPKEVGDYIDYEEVKD